MIAPDEIEALVAHIAEVTGLKPERQKNTETFMYEYQFPGRRYGRGSWGVGHRRIWFSIQPYFGMLVSINGYAFPDAGRFDPGFYTTLDNPDLIDRLNAFLEKFRPHRKRRAP